MSRKARLSLWNRVRCLMFGPRSWFGRVRGLLVEQLDDLRRSLPSLGQRVRDHIAGAVGQAVSFVVRDVVRPMLGRTPTPEQNPYGDEMPSPYASDEWLQEARPPVISAYPEPESSLPPRR